MEVRELFIYACKRAFDKWYAYAMSLDWEDNERQYIMDEVYRLLGAIDYAKLHWGSKDDICERICKIRSKQCSMRSITFVGDNTYMFDNYMWEHEYQFSSEYERLEEELKVLEIIYRFHRNGSVDI